MAKKIFAAVLAAGAVCFNAQSALAHPKLMETVPPANARAQSPLEIKLTFSEALIAKFSKVDLKDQAGKPVETGPATADQRDKKQLIMALKSPLAPGQYTVEWQVVSEDTHRIKGSYSFEVKP